MSDCECIYVKAVHPDCDRFNATMLVDLQPGSVQAQVAAMCSWCAADWHARHPYMEVVELGSGGKATSDV